LRVETVALRLIRNISFLRRQPQKQNLLIFAAAAAKTKPPYFCGASRKNKTFCF
jgi:hypothetical protein